MGLHISKILQETDQKVQEHHYAPVTEMTEMQVLVQKYLFLHAMKERLLQTNNNVDGLKNVSADLARVESKLKESAYKEFEEMRQMSPVFSKQQHLLLTGMAERARAVKDMSGFKQIFNDLTSVEIRIAKLMLDQLAQARSALGLQVQLAMMFHAAPSEIATLQAEVDMQTAIIDERFERVSGNYMQLQLLKLLIDTDIVQIDKPVSEDENPYDGINRLFEDNASTLSSSGMFSRRSSDSFASARSDEEEMQAPTISRRSA
jgi:hypothetical protein